MPLQRLDVGYRDDYNQFLTAWEELDCDYGAYVRYDAVKELEAENQRLREQRDAANYQIQILNRIIAGDVE